MLGQKEGRGRTMAQKTKKQIYSGHTTSSWEEKINTNDWQTNTNIGGYMKMPGESWSQRNDSAASMFPLAPGWEEVYQDVSSYCQESLQNMSSVKDGTKSFSCIVQDDELNTPEIRIQKFDYPTQDNVLSRDDTSPMSLFEGGMWDIPPPIVSRQTSINGKIEDIITSNEVAEYSKSHEKHLEPAKEAGSDQLKSDIEVFGDEISIPIIGHEEEIVSTEDTSFEESVTETNSILIYDKETECVQFIQSVNNSNEVTMIDSDMEDDMRETDLEANLRKLESMLDDTINFSPQDTDITLEKINDYSYSNITNPVKMEMENSVSSDVQFTLENQELKTLTSMFHEDPRTNEQINVEIPTLDEKRKSVTENPLRSDAVVQVPVQTVEMQFRQKTDLSLNLAAVFGTKDLISTPEIMDTILGEEVSFDQLLNFIQPDVQDMKTELAKTASTVDFSEISSLSYNVSNNEIKEEAPLSVMVVEPVVIKKSSDGKLTVTHKQVSGKQIKMEDGKRSGKQTLSKKRFVETVGKPVLESNDESRGELDDDWMISTSTKQNSTKRKISSKESTVRKTRGRRPREQSASTSKSETFPSRRRKSSCRSDFDDTDSPPLKRTRLSSVESESDKYRELRDKNNEASRKSRLNRKSREVEMKKSAEMLQKENQSLRIKADEMERLVKKLRQALLEVVTKVKK